MIRAHRDAILSRLRTDGTLHDATFDAVVPAGLQRYAYLFLDSGRRRGSRLTGPAVTARFTATVHSVGSDPNEAMAVQERVITQLVDHRLVVPGRTCTLIVHNPALPIDADDAIHPSLWFAVDEFTFTSDPSLPLRSEG